MLPPYSDDAPERSTLDATKGPLVLEFGNNGCGICQALLPLITAALPTTTTPHLRIQDGKGRKLGRSYRVTLWPTLVLLRNGQEVTRIVRPGSVAELTAALRQLEVAA